MSYNLRDLKQKSKIKKAEHIQSNNSIENKNNFNTVFVLDNWIGLFFLLENFSKPEYEDIQILKTRNFSDLDLLHTWLAGPSLLRKTHENFLNNRQFDFTSLSPSLFLKDGDLYSFDSRAKPYDFLFFEDHFIPTGLIWDISKFLEILQTDDWRVFYESNSKNVIISEIEKIENKQEWMISLEDGKEIFCRHLIWNLSVKTLLKSSKNIPFSLESRSIIQSIKYSSAFLFSITLNKQVCDQGHTFLIPQSYTHTWGHFVVESSLNFSTSHPWFKCLFFPQVEEINEDILLQKLKLLKRSLYKLFPSLETCDWKEKYSLDLNYASSADEAGQLSSMDLDWMKNNGLWVINGEFDGLGKAACNLSQFVENGIEASFKNLSNFS